MKICGVVVLYNPDKNINKRINSYINKIDKLYLIDNSDDDNSKMFIKNRKICYICNKKNVGIAKALNIAAKKAFSLKYDWLLTMDQDSEFTDNNLDKLIEYAKKCDYIRTAVISPWHVTKENKTFPNERIEKVVEVMTSGNLVNLQIWKKIGGWKDWFFIDNVDIEYCMNANVNGYDVIRINDASLLHNLGNIKKKKFLWKTFYCTNHNYLRQYYMIRNLLYLKELYYNDFPENIKKMERGAFGRLKNIVFWESNKLKKIRGMYRGYKDYKNNKKGIYSYKD